MHYSLMGKMRLPFIDSDLLFRGALEGRFDFIYWLNHRVQNKTYEEKIQVTPTFTNRVKPV